jgi:predicted transporter
MKAAKTIFIGVFVLAVVANQVTKVFSMRKWQTAIGLILLAGLFYISSIFLTRFFIKKKTPELASDMYWEYTAGLGIIPKWVSVIGLLSLSALITSIVPWVIALLKYLFR